MSSKEKSPKSETRSGSPFSYVEVIEQKRLKVRAKTAFPGRSGALISASGSGAPSGKTTATTVMPGTTSRTTSRALARTSWGEDGLAGISDDQQRLCFALALWNGRDPILKERPFRLDQQRRQSRRGR